MKSKTNLLLFWQEILLPQINFQVRQGDIPFLPLQLAFWVFWDLLRFWALHYLLHSRMGNESFVFSSRLSCCFTHAPSLVKFLVLWSGRCSQPIFRNDAILPVWLYQRTQGFWAVFQSQMSAQDSAWFFPCWLCIGLRNRFLDMLSSLMLAKGNRC